MVEFANLNSAKKGASKNLHGAPLIEAVHPWPAPISGRPGAAVVVSLRAHRPTHALLPALPRGRSPAPRPPPRRSESTGPNAPPPNPARPPRPAAPPRRNVKVRPWFALCLSRHLPGALSEIPSVLPAGLLALVLFPGPPLSVVAFGRLSFVASPGIRRSNHALRSYLLGPPLKSGGALGLCQCLLCTTPI